MTTNELKDELKAVAEKCDSTREQQAVAGILFSLLGAMYLDSQMALLDHVSTFSRQQLNDIQRHRASMN